MIIKKMKLCAQLLLLFCILLTQAVAADSVPGWLEQIQKQKNVKPEAMLQLMLDHKAEYGALPDPVKVVWHNELAQLYQTLGRYRDQLKEAQNGLALAGESKTKARAELFYSLGFALEEQREYARAGELYRKGLALAEELKDEQLIIDGLLNKAAIQAEDNNMETAMKTLKEAYQRAVKLNNKESLAGVNAELGLMYAALMSDEEARSLLQESYRLYDELGWEKYKVAVWYNLAETYRYQDKHDQALAIFDQMLKTALRSEDPVQIYYASLGLASVHTKLKKFDAAVSYMEQADKYLSQLQSDFQLSEHHLEKAMIYRALGQTSLALQQVDLAAEKLGNKSNMSERFYKLHFDRMRSRLYADTNEFEKAYRTLDTFVSDFLSLQDEQRELQVQKLRLEFDAERQLARNELLQKDNELQALRLQEIEQKRQNQWLWIALLGSTSLVLLVVLLWQLRRRQPQPTA